MKDVKMPHKGHGQHLCYLHNMGILSENLEEYKKLVRDAKYICLACGRVAASEKNLCAPRKLDPSEYRFRQPDIGQWPDALICCK